MTIWVSGAVKPQHQNHPHIGPLGAGEPQLLSNREWIRSCWRKRWTSSLEQNIHSLLIIRNGYIVVDATFYPFTPGTKHDVASVANLDANKEALTVEDLLTMRTGFECTVDPTETTLIEMMASPDWVQFALDLLMSEGPGTRWVYCSPGVHLLQAIIQQATGMSTPDFAREHLFNPLGISNVAWPTDPQGIIRWRFSLTFEDDQVTVAIQDMTGFFPDAVRFGGKLQE